MRALSTAELRALVRGQTVDQRATLDVYFRTAEHVYTQVRRTRAVVSSWKSFSRARAGFARSGAREGREIPSDRDADGRPGRGDARRLTRTVASRTLGCARAGENL